MREMINGQKPVKGMMMDVHPVNMPQESYRFALNLALESLEGDLMSATNEEGNSVCFTLQDSLRVIGAILVGEGNVVLFSTNDDNINEIGILTEGCTYTSLLRSSCLAFSTRYPVKGTYRIINGCETVIYFTDNRNKLRSLNLDNLIQYTELDMSGNHYSVAYANANDAWDCGLFNYSKDYVVPTITPVTVLGGSLKHGQYAFSIRYLDDDFNPTDWTPITEPVNVSDGLPNTQSEDGGVFDLISSPSYTSNKSILIGMSDLDTRYPFVEIASFHWVSGNNYEVGAFKLKVTLPVPTNGIASYVFSNNEQIDFPLPLGEFSTLNVKFDKVGSLAQVSNRLFIANTTDTTYDWAEFQRATSKVLLNPVFNSYSSQWENKSNAAYFNFRGYMRDEVYSFGIVYKFKNGSESPVFHIPGRPRNRGAYPDNTFSPVLLSNQDLVTLGNQNTDGTNSFGMHSTSNRNLVRSTLDGDPVTDNWDTLSMSITANNNKTEVSTENTEHLPANEKTGNIVDRWKVYNTGIYLPSGLRGATGITSYYETQEVYPDLRDCSGDSVWGEDAWGNSLAGTPVRHHKMPSADIIKPFDTSFTYPMGVFVYNVSYPTQYAGEIDGYYIVRIKRNAVNKTVIDKGYICGSRVALDNSLVQPHIYLDIQNQSLYDDVQNKTHVFVSPVAMFKRTLGSAGYYKLEGHTLSNGPFITGTSAPDVKNYNRQITGYVYVDDRATQESISPFVQDLYNVFYNTHVLFHYTPDKINVVTTPLGDNRLYAAVKRYLKPYGNFMNETYIRCSGVVFRQPQAGVYGGDTFISRLTMRQIHDLPPSTTGTAPSTFSTFMCESEINSEMRSHGIRGWETHYDFFRGAGNSDVDFITLENTDLGLTYSLDYWEYADMYSADNYINVYFPLPVNYDYCLDCQGSYPTRIWGSEKATLEEREDKYRVVLPNSYVDLPTNHGAISSVIAFRENLYALTDFASWGIPINPQELSTNENTVFVGTGELFSQEPKMLETVERGYAGCQHVFGSVVTEHGAVFVDAHDGRVFLLGQGLRELSGEGMRNWFIKNLPITDKSYVSGYNNYNSIVHPSGCGVAVVYDPRHARVIIHKRDWKLRDPQWLASLVSGKFYTEGVLYGFNTTTQHFYRWPSGFPKPTIVYVATDTDLSENRSWTISFSLINNCWESFKSYRPSFMWSNRTKFYSYINTESDPINYYAHGSRNYGEFYGSKYKTMLEYIVNADPSANKTLNSITYDVNFYSVDDNLKEAIVQNETFNEAFLYNSYQGTGLLQIQPLLQASPFAEVFNSYPSVYAKKTEGKWSMSEFKDMVSASGQSMLTSDWNNSIYRVERSIQGSPYTYNSAAIDGSKSPFEQEVFRDRWVGVRLIYNNTNSYKMISDLYFNQTNISFR